jgi:hypothetical protein|tara:strand:+ start:1171 stop:1404 length:234 start_codon:yes stop_codon:yes gene_type:complete
MAKKYVIIEPSELSSLDFSKLTTTSSNTVRYNVARDKCLVSFQGNTPSELNGKTEYTEAQIFTIVDNISNGWYENEE